MTAIEKYNQHVATPSDINEHLETLLQYATGCKHITEMGTRRAVSTYAFLMAKPEKLVCYDLARYPEVDEVEQIAKDEGIEFEFHLANVLDVEIETTDFLFIDTAHQELQCKAELEKHSGKVRRFIAFHDVATYGRNAEPVYSDQMAVLNNGRGIMYAIEDFLEKNPSWHIVFHTEVNNGLMVIERMA